MGVTEVQETAASTTGTWNTQTNAVYSGGTAIQSATAGATATFNVTGRAIWLLTATSEAGGQFTVTVDGQAYQGGSCFGVGANARNRVLLPLARNLADGAHTVVIAAAGTAPVTVDSLLAVSGAALAPTPGNVVALGDSITINWGLQNALAGWPSRLTELLGHRLNRKFALFNKGISGDSLFCADSTHVGGMYRLFSDVYPNAPEVLTVMFGTNDLLLNATVPGEYAAHLLSALQFIEDVFAVQQMAVIVCVPTFLGPLALASAINGNQGGYYAGNAADNHRLSLELVKVIANMFSWANIAYTHEVMDDTESLVYPNGGFDSTHPNDAGHSVIAIEMFRSVLERFAKIGKA